MTDATRKATSRTRKDFSGALAQLLAVTAMLVIAGFAFFARGNGSASMTAMTSDHGPTPAVFTEHAGSDPASQLPKQNVGFVQHDKPAQ